MTFHWRIVRYHIRKSSYFLFYLVINRMYRVVFPSSFQNFPPARNLTEAHVISELTGTDNTRFQVVSLFVPQQFWQGTNRKSIVTLEPPQKKKNRNPTSSEARWKQSIKEIATKTAKHNKTRFFGTKKGRTHLCMLAANQKKTVSSRLLACRIASGLDRIQLHQPFVSMKLPAKLKKTFFFNPVFKHMSPNGFVFLK